MQAPAAERLPGGHGLLRRAQHARELAGLRVALAGITANAIEAMESALEDAEAQAADAAAEAPDDHAGSDSPTTADPPDGTG